MRQRSFDAYDLLLAIQSERSTNITIVGDVLAKPIVSAIDRREPRQREQHVIAGPRGTRPGRRHHIIQSPPIAEIGMDQSPTRNSGLGCLQQFIQTKRIMKPRHDRPLP